MKKSDSDSFDETSAARERDFRIVTSSSTSEKAPNRRPISDRLSTEIYKARRIKAASGKAPTYQELAKRFNVSKIQAWYACNSSVRRNLYLSKRLLPFDEVLRMHFNEVKARWEAEATLKEMADEFNCRPDSIWRCIMILTEPTPIDKAVASLEQYSDKQFYDADWNGRIYQRGNGRFFQSGASPY